MSSTKKLEFDYFFETKPLEEISLKRLTHSIHVSENVTEQGAPKRLLIHTNNGNVIRYLKMSSIPEEILRVINFLPNSYSGDFDKSQFIKAIEDLLRAAKNPKNLDELNEDLSLINK